MQRFSTVFKAKASKTVDRYQDPRETLDHSYERTLQTLQKMRRTVTDVATSRKRIELKAQQLQQPAAKLDAQAKQAILHYQFQQRAGLNIYRNGCCPGWPNRGAPGRPTS
jgi:phage shock protein A